MKKFYFFVPVRKQTKYPSPLDIKWFSPKILVQPQAYNSNTILPPQRSNGTIVRSCNSVTNCYKIIKLSKSLCGYL